jgi:hypothetical protein
MALQVQAVAALKVTRAFQRVKAETSFLTNFTRWKARATPKSRHRVTSAQIITGLRTTTS